MEDFLWHRWLVRPQKSFPVDKAAGLAGWTYRDSIKILVYVIGLFEEAISEYGKPGQIITDHGAQYWSTRGGTSRFTRFCQEHDIQHILGSIRKPTIWKRITLLCVNEGYVIKKE